MLLASTVTAVVRLRLPVTAMALGLVARLGLVGVFVVAGLVLFGCAITVTRGRWLGAAAMPAGSGPAPRTPAASR